MGIEIVCAENWLYGETYAINLIALLVVLVSPHIVAEGAGKSVKCNNLKSFKPFYVPGVCIQKLVRKHLLHYSAQLCALNGTKTC